MTEKYYVDKRYVLTSGMYCAANPRLAGTFLLLAFPSGEPVVVL
jgi:hypothetical protein